MTAAEIIKEACRGNVEAERFCKAWADYAHLVDDLEDKDVPVTAERLAEVLSRFMVCLSFNPFFQRNKPLLVALMIQSANAWLDSNSPTDSVEGAASRDVLKGMWHEVIYHVAYIVGGWKHLRAVTSECREYDFEKKVGR